MIKINLIAAIDKDNGLGFKNELLYRIKDDMEHFVKLTRNGTVIMGRKTFESLPNKQPLPFRANVIITKNPSLNINISDTFNGKVRVVDSITSAVTETSLLPEKYKNNIFVIGGGEIYKGFLDNNYINGDIYLTKVLTRKESDTFMPDVSKYGFKLYSKSPVKYDEETGLMYQFEQYKKEE